MNMNSKTQLEEKPAKRLSVRALVIIDVLATCFSLGVFALFFFDLLGISPSPNRSLSSSWRPPSRK